MLRLLLVAIAVLGMACGGRAERSVLEDNSRQSSNDRTGPACWDLTEPIDEPTTPLEEACTLVITEHRRALDAAFTTYARGELPVYTGALHVISDLPEHELTNPSYYEDTREEIDGDVIARIVARVPEPNINPHPIDPGEGLELEISSTEQPSYTLVLQSDGTTGDVVFSTVLPFGAIGVGSLVPGRIDGLSLAEAPDRIDFEFDERYEARGWFYRVRAQGTLTRIDPTEVTPEHALALDRAGTMAGFENGTDGVIRQVERTSYFSAPIPEALDFVPSECARRVTYSLLENVDRSGLSASLAEVLVSSTELCCTRCEGPECIDSGFDRQCFP
jgi:hypothetical protein